MALRRRPRPAPRTQAAASARRATTSLRRRSSTCSARRHRLDRMSTRQARRLLVRGIGDARPRRAQDDHLEHALRAPRADEEQRGGRARRHRGRVADHARRRRSGARPRIAAPAVGRAAVVPAGAAPAAVVSAAGRIRSADAADQRARLRIDAAGRTAVRPGPAAVRCTAGALAVRSAAPVLIFDRDSLSARQRVQRGAGPFAFPPLRPRSRSRSRPRGLAGRARAPR